ncbi:MAG: hypothetical protein VX899_16090 [Myxococcota bacterium]|nr:hypothetical protein [Myxococcota bacterium]
MSDRPRAVASELWRYLRAHAVHLLLAVPMAIFVTTCHELAHAAAAKAFGAEIGHIWVLPGNGSWGHMSYTLPSPHPSASFWVSVAPSLTGLGVGLALTVLAVTRPPKTPFWAGFLFVWGVVTPLLEPSYQLFQWLSGDPNDLAKALGPPTALGAAFTLVYGAMVVFAGWHAQRSVYRERALTQVPFGVLVLAVWATLLLLG